MSALKRLGYPAWIALIAGLALVHGVHLTADFPLHSPWPDWAKFTDEGWYANAAIRAHRLGHWYEPGGFNPAVAVPLWPAWVWLLFCFTGVSLVAVRGLAVALFCLNLLLIERLLRGRVPRWAVLLALTLLVTSPFLFAFSRLALVEPLLLTLALLALGVGQRLATTPGITTPGITTPKITTPGIPRQASLLGLLMAAMILAKTTAIFLLPAIGWAAFLPLRTEPRRLARALAACAGSSGCVLALWAAVLIHFHLLGDLTYFFWINRYPKPHTTLGWLASLGWAVHGMLWIDPLLMPLLAGLLLVWLAAWGVRGRPHWASMLGRDSLFSASLLGMAGLIGFMAAQDHTQPRYYTVVAVFAFVALAQLLDALLRQGKALRRVGSVALLVVAFAVARNSVETLRYALHPSYTWIDAARSLTAYVDAHPHGRRLLLATSGDEITLMTGLPAMCDDFGTDLPERRIRRADPGWFAAWNDLDPAMLAAIHASFALRQVATYPVMDDPERNRLVLFRLVPRRPAPGTARNFDALGRILPEDHVSIDVQ